MAYIKKHCLFCENPSACEQDGNLVMLYPQTFEDEDLNAEVFSARRVTEHFHYKIFKCKKTGLIFSGEILSDDVLLKLYAGSKITFNEYTHLIRKDYWRHLKPFAASLIKERALEIGCSNGFFLEELLEQGYREVFGCEPSLEAKNLAPSRVKENIYSGFFTQGIYPDNFFDLVCSFQTLDHLSEPLDILKTCYNILKPGGHAYFITHDVNGLQARIFGEKSPIIDVEHIYLFNNKTLSMLGEKAGFRTIKTFSVRNTYPLKYWMSHAPIPMKKFFLNIAKHTGLENRNISIRAGNLGILFQKD